MVAAHQQQTAWLGEDLAAHQSDTFKIAGYHKPIRPHTSTKAENDHELAWADLFDLYGLTIANESDTHNHKLTFPITRSDADGNDMGFVRDDANGVLYVGEGSPGIVNVAEVSWLLDFSAQPADFLLATLTFSGLDRGMSPLTIVRDELSDDLGFPLVVSGISNGQVNVPLPGTALLLAPLGLLMRRRVASRP